MKVGDIVKGRITGIKPYGAFVKIDETVDGLIHISELSDSFVKNIEDYLAVGDVVNLEVLAIGKDHKVSLSFKRVNHPKRKKYVQVKLTKGFEPFETKLPEWVEEYGKKDGK